MLYSISKLPQNTLTKIQDLEKKLGHTLLALTPQAVDFAQANQQDLEQIKNAEKDLGVILVAVK